MPPVRLSPSLKPPYDRLALSHKAASFPCSCIGRDRQPLVLPTQLHLAQASFHSPARREKGRAYPRAFSSAHSQFPQSSSSNKTWIFSLLRAATHSRHHQKNLSSVTGRAASQMPKWDSQGKGSFLKNCFPSLPSRQWPTAWEIWVPCVCHTTVGQLITGESCHSLSIKYLLAYMGSSYFMSLERVDLTWLQHTWAVQTTKLNVNQENRRS